DGSESEPLVTVVPAVPPRTPRPHRRGRAQPGRGRAEHRPGRRRLPGPRHPCVHPPRPGRGAHDPGPTARGHAARVKLVGMDRRTFLVAGAGALIVAACGGKSSKDDDGARRAPASTLSTPASPATT